MTSQTALTARNGKFVVDSTTLARATGWDVSSTLASSSEWGDSDSAGFTNRAAGRKSASFNASGKYDTAVEVFDTFQPEDISIAVLWMDAIALYWDFPRALNNDFSITIDIDSEEVIGWTSAWSSDGVFYYPGEVGATVRTLPA